MSVDKETTKMEERKFQDTKRWIKDELCKTRDKYSRWETRVADLKKAAKGSYSTDLILAENSFSMVKKNIHKYEESSDNPYFARIDFKEPLKEPDVFYIGKFGITDEDNMEEIVIDWRAPVANLYYSGTFGEASYRAPIGEINGDLLLKRKFQVKDGEIVNIFDEGVNELIVPASEDGNELVDEFLKVNLEENMSKKLKDVITTIQKEQNDIIRAYKNKPIIIQGSAGSGKTTVALHRLAYLVYTYGDEMNNKNILVVAPNEIFLDYISDILPNLGVSNVKQVTFEGMCREILKTRYKLLTKDDKIVSLIETADEENKKYIMASSGIKGTIAYKLMMDRLIRYAEKTTADSIKDITIDKYVIFPINEIKKLYIKNISNLPLNKRRAEIEKYFTSKLKIRMEDIKKQIEDEFYFQIKDIKTAGLPEEEMRKQIISIYDKRDEIIKNIGKNSKKAIKEYFKQWKDIDPFEIYGSMINDESVFSMITGGEIPEKLSRYIKQEFNKNLENKVIDCDDLTAITYLKLKLDGGSGEHYIHTVIDEAQDYSMLQFSVLCEITSNNSMTIVGDLGQGIYSYKGVASWEKLINRVFSDDGTYITLTQSYRSTVEIIDFANKVLSKQNLNVTPAKPILRHGPEPHIIKVMNSERVEKINRITESVIEQGKKTIALICKDLKQCREIYKALNKSKKYNWTLMDNNHKTMDNNLMIVPSYMTKGLEFDATIVIDCDDNNYGSSDMDKKILYVVLTRALHLEYVLYEDRLTALLE